MMDIIGKLRTFATSKGWHFILGSMDGREYMSADRHDYTEDELVMVVDFNYNPSINMAGMMDSIDYRGFIMLGRKFEATTEANLDETLEQKYDRRMLYLLETFIAEIGGFACANRFTLSLSNGRQMPNIASDNIDFIYFDVTFTE